MADQTAPDPNRDVLAAIREALDVPRAREGEYEKSVRLRHDRALSVLGILDGMLDRGHTAEVAAESLRHACRTYSPITYPIAFAEVPDHPDSCEICGPGCCSPVIGIHGCCPGPAAGATVVSAR